MLTISKLISGLAKPQLTRNTYQIQSITLHCRFHYHNDGLDLPRQYGFYRTKAENKLLYGKRIMPKLKAQFQDVL